MGNGVRLFIAITLDEQVRSRLAAVQARLRDRCQGVRWVRPEQVHVTLKFLGEVRDRDVPSVCAAVEYAAGAGKPFSLTVAGSGCFPKRGPVRIVWAGLDEPSGALLGLASALENECEKLGFPRERRPFSPHITIGRVREDRSDGKIRSAVDSFQFDSVSQSVEDVTVMSSVLSPKGPTYTAVSTAALGAVGR